MFYDEGFSTSTLTCTDLVKRAERQYTTLLNKYKWSWIQFFFR